MKRTVFLLCLGLAASGAFWLFRAQRAELAEIRRHLASHPTGSRAASSSTASPAPAPPPPAGPSAELLRLRGEVGLLRRELAEAAQPEPHSQPPSNDWEMVYGGVRPSQQPGFLYFTNAADVGFATPQAALQTFHFAMGNQSKQPLTNTRMKELWDVPDDYDQEPGYNIHLGEGLYGGTGYRIVSSQILSSNTLRLTIDYEKDNGSSYRRTKDLVQTAGRWRIKPQSVTRAQPPTTP